jgi:aspartate aminotransferase
MIALSERVSQLSVSATLAVKRKADELRAQGADLVDFGIGEPDFHTPEPIKQAAYRAIQENFTKYTEAGGIRELREAVAQKYQREYGASFDPAREIMITCGAKQALYNAAFALFEPGDEVIIPTPYWVSYPEQIKLTGANVLYFNTQEQCEFSLTSRELEGALTPRTKAVILNFPNNPSGAILDRAELKRIVELARARGFYVIYDECYEQFIYDGPPLSPAPYGLANVILAGSCSKTYAMTGWRTGWAVGPAPIIQAMEKLQSQCTSNPTSIAQRAALEALTGDQRCVGQMIAEYRRRRDAMVKGLNEISGIHCNLPKGSFFVFPNVTGLFTSSIQNSTDLARHVLEKAGVVTISGVEFGRDGFLRISYATSMERIQEGLQRLRTLLG